MDNVIEGQVLAASSTPGEVTYKQTALVITGDLEFSAWASTGETLQGIFDGIGYFLGDWYNYGQKRWGDVAVQAVFDISNRKPSTVQNYAWVCRHVPPAMRRPELSFGHHYAVAALAERNAPLAVELLETAIVNDWKREELRAQVATILKGLPAGDSGDSEPLDAPTMVPANHCVTCTCTKLAEDDE